MQIKCKSETNERFDSWNGIYELVYYNYVAPI